MIDITRNRRTKLKVEEIDFKLLIENARVELKGLVLAHKLQITFLADGLMPFYHDNEFIQVIFTNLISNAIKYQHEHEVNPKLNIVAEVSATNAIISFKDNGIGIPQGDIGKVFDMFYRVPGTKAEGAGLGLYIVKQVIRKLKGRIYVESLPGEGSKFVLEIPNKIDPDLVRKLNRLIQNT